LRWQWWLRLATVGILVKDLYMFTEFSASSNAVAGSGTLGQEVVRTPQGTLVLLVDSGRILCPNGGAALNSRTKLNFQSFDNVRHQQSWHKGREPRLPAPRADDRVSRFSPFQK
jgi:hypothetical protein